MTSGVRDYEGALQTIGSLIFSRTRADGSSWQEDFNTVHTCVKHLGLEEDLPKMSVIHVAGTKGKGSTCAFVESIMRTTGCSTGLFTSPHLVDIRERFRFNGKPCSQETFTKHFWVVWDKLQAAATPEAPMPTYFRFITLLGLHMFIHEKVQVVILEVGLGGRWDATNVVPAPVVCGVTSLGYDHVELLGHTLALIAGEKAGIFKPNVPAFTSPQDPEAMESLERRANELQIPLTVVSPLDMLFNKLDPASGSDHLTLGLAGSHQRLNAALAITLCRTYAQRVPNPPPALAAGEEMFTEQGMLPACYVEGLQTCTWPGRAQVLHDDEVLEGQGSLTFYLDGAHTEESMVECARWWAESVTHSESSEKQAPGEGGPMATQRFMLFNCTMERDPNKLMKPLAAMVKERNLAFARAVFVPPDSTTNIKPTSGDKDTRWQQKLRHTWQTITQTDGTSGKQDTVGGGSSPSQTNDANDANSSSDTATTAVIPSMHKSIEWFREQARARPAVRTQVLVTGSLYLVGDMLRIIRRGVPL